MVAEAAANDKPLVLVDGSTYLFRAFHALPPLTAADGFPTGAMRGVIAMIRKLAKDYPGSPLVIVFDPKGKTFRDDLYSEYKANRPPMDDDLRKQIEPTFEIIRAMGLPLLTVPEVEADDVIGTLASQASAQGRAVLISTSDKDMAQLVNDRVTLLNTMSETSMDRDGVVEKFGVPPELIIDYLALMGDKVDNIPGVPKVGPKTAAKWLNEHGSLDAVMAAADSIKGKIGENLRASLGHLPLSQILTTIKCDVDVGVPMAELTAPPQENAEALRALFERYQFNSWLGELEDAEPEPEPAQDRHYECVTTEAALDAWIAQLEAAPLFAFDTETTSINYMQAELVGFSFAVEPNRAAYVPVGHRYPGAPDQLPLDLVLSKLKPLLADPNKPKVGQHLKYDMNVLARVGVPLEGIAFDTMLESYVLDSTAGRHNMDDLARKHLGVRTTHYEDVAGKGAKQLSFDQVDLEAASDYAAEDADVTLQLHQALWPKLEQHPSLVRVFEDIELPLIPVLSRIERNGAALDGAALRRQSQELAEQIVELQEEAWTIAGSEFNLDSPKQLQEIFFERLDMPVLRKTPKGQPSTAEPVLRDLEARGYDLPKVILKHRTLTKLKGTYTDKLPLDIDPNTGRIHTSYHQAVAATGRLSSADPNLQNIPIRNAEGRRVRQAFNAPRRTPHRGGGLQPDRAAHHGAPVPGRGPAVGVRGQPGHPPGHRRRSVRRHAGSGERRGPAQSQGHQLRPDVRHVGLRPRPPVGHSAAGGQGPHGPLLHPFPRRGRLHGPHPRPGPRSGLRGNGLRPPPVPARNQRPPDAAPPRRRARRHQRALAGHRRRHHQAGHAQRR